LRENVEGERMGTPSLRGLKFRLGRFGNMGVKQGNGWKVANSVKLRPWSDVETEVHEGEKHEKLMHRP
jgi:hypothetical protein